MSTAVVAPSGRPEQIIPALPETESFPAEVSGDAHPLVKNDVHRVFFFQWFGESVADRLIGCCRQFWLKGAEELIPDDEEHAHVLIQIFCIGSMMNPVVGGRYEDMFDPAEFVHFLRMHQDAPDLCDGINESDINGPVSAQRDRYEIKKTVQRFHDGRSETHGEIEFGRRVVGDMCGPEQPAHMVHPVQPVIHEIFEDQEADPVEPNVFRTIEESMVIEKNKDDTDGNGPEKQIQTAVQQHEVNVLQGILQGIAGLLPFLADEEFQADDDQVQRRADEDEQLFPGCSHVYSKIPH